MHLENTKPTDIKENRVTYCYPGKVVLCPAVLAPGLQRLEGISTRMTFPSEKSPIS